MSVVFISHSASDVFFIEEALVPLLASHKIETWFAKEAIEGATQWERGILTALKSSDWLVVVLTPRAVASKWVRAELAWWFDEKYEPAKGNLVPLLLEDCDWKELHVMMRSVQCIDCRIGAFREFDCRRRIVSCFGVQLRRRAITKESKTIANLAGPIVFVEVVYARSPVKFAISTEQYWFADGSPQNVGELLTSNLGLNTESPHLAQVSLVATRERLVMIVFKSGICMFVRPAEESFEFLSALKVAIPEDPCCATILPNDQLAFGYADGSVLLVTSFGSVVELVKPRNSSVVAIGASYQSRMVIAWEDGVVEIRPLGDTFKRKVVTLDSLIGALLCHNSPDSSSFFALGCNDGRIHIFDYEGESIKILDCCARAVTRLSWGTRLTAVSDSELLKWSVDLSGQRSGSYLEFVWPIEEDLTQITFVAEVPVARTGRIGAIDSYIVLGFRDGRVVRHLVAEGR
jgi:hypothetical protein